MVRVIRVRLARLVRAAYQSTTHLAVCKPRRVDLAAARDGGLQRRKELVDQARQKHGCRLLRDRYVARLLLCSLGILALLVAPVLLQLRVLR